MGAEETTLAPHGDFRGWPPSTGDGAPAVPDCGMTCVLAGQAGSQGPCGLQALPAYQGTVFHR